jgi:hypothetical protein
VNATDTAALVARCLESGTGLWIGTDYGDVDLWGDDLRDEWDRLSPGEAFDVLGIITKETT